MAFVNGLEMVPDSSVLCLEERSGNIKRIYALYIASERASRGEPVHYLTLQSPDDIRDTMARLKIPASGSLAITALPPAGVRHDVVARIQEPGAPLVIIDQFSVIFAQDSFPEMTSLLFSLMTASRKGTTFLLLVDSGVLGEREEHLVRAMADGIIRFVIVPEGDKLKNYIDIPKMRGSFPRDKMLPFTLGDEGLLIDTRERHG